MKLCYGISPMRNVLALLLLTHAITGVLAANRTATENERGEKESAVEEKGDLPGMGQANQAYPQPHPTQAELDHFASDIRQQLAEHGAEIDSVAVVHGRKQGYFIAATEMPGEIDTPGQLWKDERKNRVYDMLLERFPYETSTVIFVAEEKIQPDQEPAGHDRRKFCQSNNSDRRIEEHDKQTQKQRSFTAKELIDVTLQKYSGDKTQDFPKLHAETKTKSRAKKAVHFILSDIKHQWREDARWGVGSDWKLLGNKIRGCVSADPSQGGPEGHSSRADAALPETSLSQHSNAERKREKPVEANQDASSTGQNAKEMGIHLDATAVLPQHASAERGRDQPVETKQDASHVGQDARAKDSSSPAPANEKEKRAQSLDETGVKDKGSSSPASANAERKRAQSLDSNLKASRVEQLPIANKASPARQNQSPDPKVKTSHAEQPAEASSARQNQSPDPKVKSNQAEQPPVAAKASPAEKLKDAIKKRTDCSASSSKEGVKQAAKGMIHKPRKLQASCVDMIEDVIDNWDRKPESSAEGPKQAAGTYCGDGRIPKVGAYAEARTGEVSAHVSVLSATARGPGVAAGVEANLLTGVSAYASAEVCKAEASIAGAKVGVGLQFNTGVSAGVEGVSLNVGGFGCSVGPKMSISVPVGEVSCSIM